MSAMHQDDCETATNDKYHDYGTGDSSPPPGHEVHAGVNFQCLPVNLITM